MGQLTDPAYIAAVAMGAAMFSAVYWMFGFLRMGTTGLAAQAYGRRDHDEVSGVFLRASFIAAGLGGLIVACQWPLRELLFLLFQASPQVTELADNYYTIRVWGAPALLIHLVQLGTLFGLQRMKDTLWLSIGLNISNLVLDVVLVLGFGLDVRGVALGTVISEWGAAGFGLWLVIRALPGNKPLRSLVLWDAEKVTDLFNISGNLVLRTFFVQMPFFAGTVLATRLGDITLAAHGVLMQLFFVMTYSIDGFAHTAETLAGYAYGARDAKQLRTASIYASVWALFLALLTGLIYLLGGETFIALLTQSEAVRSAASAYLPWVALAPLLCIWAFLLDGIFIGTTFIKEMRNAMVLASLGWALLLALTFDSWGYHAVWLGMNFFMLLRAALLGIYYPRIEAGAQA